MLNKYCAGSTPTAKVYKERNAAIFILAARVLSNLVGS